VPRARKGAGDSGKDVKDIRKSGSTAASPYLEPSYIQYIEASTSLDLSCAQQNGGVLMQGIFAFQLVIACR